MHDNVMAATVIGIADLSLVNMMKLYSASIAEILEIVAESFIKFRQMMVLEHPSLCFVHQDVREIDNGESANQEAQSKLIERLDAVCMNASSKYSPNTQYSFDQILPKCVKGQYINPLYDDSSANSAISYKYVKSIQRLKHELLTLLSTRKLSFSEIAVRFEMMSKVVMQEKFNFTFQNSFELNAYRHIEKIYV
jgi:hypothetical protein